MDRLDAGFFPEQGFIRFLAEFQDLRIHVRFPPRVSARRLGGRARKLEDRLDGEYRFVELRGDGTSLARRQGTPFAVVLMTATFVDVSTRFGMSALIFSTPWGRAEIAFRIESCSALEITFAFPWPGSSAKLTARSGSTDASSPFSVTFEYLTAASASTNFFFGRNTTAEHSRGIALRLFPPSIDREPRAEGVQPEKDPVQDSYRVPASLVDLQSGMSALQAAYG